MASSTQYTVSVDVITPSGSVETYVVQMENGVHANRFVEEAETTSRRFLQIRDYGSGECLYIRTDQVVSISVAPTDTTRPGQQALRDASTLAELWPDGDLPGGNELMRLTGWGGSKSSGALAAYRSLNSQGGAR